MKVSDTYTRQEFDDLLGQAEGNAKSTFEEEFTSDMRDKFDEFEAEMFLSEKQDEILNRIANKGDW